MQIITGDVIRNRLDFARAIANRHYEKHPNGIFFPKQGLLIGGQYTTWVNDADMQVDPNVVTAEGINALLNRRFITGAAAGAYIACFLNNLTPGDALTAASFDSDLNEWTTYNEANRPAWTLPGATTTKALSNAAAPAVFTASVGVAALNVYGAAILDGQNKESTTGGCTAASKFSAARVLNAGDKLTVQYDLAGASA